MDRERNEPLTPMGRLLSQPEMDQVINCIIGLERPIQPEALRAEILNSLMLKHPRFRSLMVRDRRGRERWQKTELQLHRHLIVRHHRVGSDDSATDEDAVNEYSADLAVSSPLSPDKPLWEIHLLMAHNCAVVRIHHALGDGTSLMSLLLLSCRRVDDPDRPPTITSLGAPSNPTSGRREWMVWRFLKTAWFTLIFCLAFSLRCLWVRDKKTAMSGGAGVELWPRKLATAKFLLDDMKTVKNAVPDATINDVLSGVVSSGLSKYLDIQTPEAPKEGLQITGIAMVNLRPQPGLQEISDMIKSNSRSWWGNKFGMLLLPLNYHPGGSDPLQHLKSAKKMMDKKKLSLEAMFSYKMGDFLMSWFGARFASFFAYRVVCNTTFTISNLVGPKEKVMIAGNPVSYLRTNVSSLPHALIMHMRSYAGRADMQILVAKDIIPDPKLLAKCFEDALLEMKQAAEISPKCHQNSSLSTTQKPRDGEPFEIMTN